MIVLVHYSKPAGHILGVWQADPTTLLTSQANADSPTQGYALTDTEVPMRQILSDYVWQDGALVAKTAVTLVAEPSAFAADGTSECSVTIEPFVPCTLLIDGQPLVLTQEDPIVVLTADAPHTFQVQLMAPAPCRAADLTVEAT